MHASTQAITKSLAAAAQAMGLDVVSALAVETAARVAPAQAVAQAAGDYSRTRFMDVPAFLDRLAETGAVGHLAADGCLTITMPGGLPLFKVEPSRKG